MTGCVGPVRVTPRSASMTKLVTSTTTLVDTLVPREMELMVTVLVINPAASGSPVTVSWEIWPATNSPYKKTMELPKLVMAASPAPALALMKWTEEGNVSVPTRFSKSIPVKLVISMVKVTELLTNREFVELVTEKVRVCASDRKPAATSVAAMSRKIRKQAKNFI